MCIIRACSKLCQQCRMLGWWSNLSSIQKRSLPPWTARPTRSSVERPLSNFDQESLEELGIEWVRPRDLHSPTFSSPLWPLLASRKFQRWGKGKQNNQALVCLRGFWPACGAQGRSDRLRVGCVHRCNGVRRATPQSQRRNPRLDGTRTLKVNQPADSRWDTLVGASVEMSMAEASPFFLFFFFAIAGRAAGTERERERGRVLA